MTKKFYALIFMVAALQAAGTTQETAQKIMGKNFIGIADVEKSFGVKYAPEQLKTLANIPYSEATLRETASSHVLVAGYPLMVDEMVFRLLKNGIPVYDYQRVVFSSGAKLFQVHHEEEIAFWLVSRNRINLAEFKDLFHSWKTVTAGGSGWGHPWFDQNMGVNNGWYLLRKQIFFPYDTKDEAVFKSNLEKEKKLFAPSPGARYEEIAFRELLYCVTLARIARGERLFVKSHAKSSDEDNEEARHEWSSTVKGVLYLNFEDEGYLTISGTGTGGITRWKLTPTFGRAPLRKFD